MSEKEYIDFKKEFKEFAQDLENSKPIFDDEELSFDDFDNLFNEKESLCDNDKFLNDCNNENKGHDELFNDFNDLDDFFASQYPEISLETEELFMNLSLKKDYSEIKDLNLRKKEFFKDLRDFIDEFEST
ncbi:MAG: hypothetical protein IKV87_07075, partial [Methanobrevibacter sp.]|nr:hypothetical protein [Methanobrevibacter sp.]